jgi:hypothetical protein
MLSLPRALIAQSDGAPVLVVVYEARVSVGGVANIATIQRVRLKARLLGRGENAVHRGGHVLEDFGFSAHCWISLRMRTAFGYELTHSTPATQNQKRPFL